MMSTQLATIFPVNQVTRRFGRSLTLLLPLALVLSGTLAVTRVPWSPSPDSSQVLTADAGTSTPSHTPEPRPDPSPENALLDTLLDTLHRQDPDAALTQLHQAVRNHPSLAAHCTDLSRQLGQAAARQYGAKNARHYAKPVCDDSFQSGTRT